MLITRKLVFLAFLSVSWVLSAQDNPAYVTKIDAVALSAGVQLTWLDAEGYTGAKYEIWRAEKELVKDSLPSAKLVGTVESGVMKFEDTTVTVPSFYLILLKDADGNRRSFYIPGRNKTTIALAPLAANVKGTASISGLSTTLSGKNLLLQFKALPGDRKLNVYRTTTPVKALADLKTATLLGQTTGAKAPWVDTPPPGLEFYYTILDAAAFSEGAADVFSPANTTDQSAGFPLISVPDAGTQTPDTTATTSTSATPASATAAATSATAAAAVSADLRPTIDQNYRPLPLPMLNFINDPTTGQAMAIPPETVTTPTPVSAATEKVLSAWTKGNKNTAIPLPAPVVLPEETVKGSVGTQKLLAQVVQSYFQQKDWKTSAEQLNLLLKLELEPKLESRAHFYLGQALAFQKDYRQAFLEILMAKDDYSAATEGFLESLFSLLPSVQD